MVSNLMLLLRLKGILWCEIVHELCEKEIVLSLLPINSHKILYNGYKNAAFTKHNISHFTMYECKKICSDAQARNKENGTVTQAKVVLLYRVLFCIQSW